MLHPAYAPTDYHPAEGLGSNPQDHTFKWEQNWAVCEVDDKDKLHIKKVAKQAADQPSPSESACVDLKRRKSQVYCGKGNKWCRSIVMFQVDHIRDVNYFFKTEVAYDLYTSEKYTEDMSVPYKVTIETMNAEYTSFEMVSFSGSVCPMILRIISSSSVQTLFDRHSRRDSSTSSS